MKKIIPHLWFDNSAEEAVEFYISIFNNSKILKISHYGEAGSNISGMQKDSVLTVDFMLEGQEFIALNGGPAFKFSPAISFFVNCETVEDLDKIWEKLFQGGVVLMELDQYPFSKKFGWIQDKFGVSWQLNLAHSKEKITPFLMFVGEQNGKAEEAMNFYTSLFDNSKVVEIERYKSGEGNEEGTVKLSRFILDGQEFMAIDSSLEHSFTFSEAISFYVNCDTQEEIDKLWDKLSEWRDEGQCGWIKDKYSVSWQVVPKILDGMMNDTDPVKSEGVMRELLKMKKLDIAKLQQAYNRK